MGGVMAKTVTFLTQFQTTDDVSGARATAQIAVGGGGTFTLESPDGSKFTADAADIPGLARLLAECDHFWIESQPGHPEMDAVETSAL